MVHRAATPGRMIVAASDEVPVTANLTLHLDATKITGLSDGDDVSQWDDESGNSNHAEQSTASKRPVYKTSIQNGKPIVRFTASNVEFLDTPDLNVTQPNTIFMVAKARDDSGTYEMFLHTDSLPSQIVFITNSGPSWSLYANSIISGGTADQNFHYLSAIFDGSSSEMWVDGSSEVTGDPGASGVNVVRLAAGNGEGNPSDVDIGEVLIYDAALSTSDRQSVESYLASKWNL